MNEWITVSHARVHNLKNINVQIPKNQLVVITGPSGSGKSSLAFDTLFAYGQRRYLESLSLYARQIVNQLPDPDVDRIDGILPTIAVAQEKAMLRATTTVGSLTEISSYFRLLYCQQGQLLCPEHHVPLRSYTVDEMMALMVQKHEGHRMIVSCPVHVPSDTTPFDLLLDLIRQGYSRIRVKGQIQDLNHESAIQLAQQVDDSVDLVIDRIRFRDEQRARLAQSVELALNLGEGTLWIEDLDLESLDKYTTKPQCPCCSFERPSPVPAQLNNATPSGQCTYCQGYGTYEDFDANLLLQDAHKSIAQGAFGNVLGQEVMASEASMPAWLQALDVDVTVPWCALSSQQQQTFLYGDGFQSLGYLGRLSHLWAQQDAALQKLLKPYRRPKRCTHCQGSGLSSLAFDLVWSSKAYRYIDMMTQPVRDLPLLLEQHLASHAYLWPKIGVPLVSRLKMMIRLGLGHLQLGQFVSNLSDSEHQKLRLVSQLHKNLSGILYVLDEPAAGLPPQDIEALVHLLKELCEQGNTVVVVEHSKLLIEKADYVIELGPLGGQEGGHVLAAGTLSDLKENPCSQVGPWLLQAPLKVKPQALDGGQTLFLDIQQSNTLTLEVTQGQLVGLTGQAALDVSSSLMATLLNPMAYLLEEASAHTPPRMAVRGVENFSKILKVDAQRIGRSSRSTIATYLDIFKPIREIFAQTRMAKERGYDAKRFSTHVGDGRCLACQGEGTRQVNLQFLETVMVDCTYCHGTGFNQATLECLYKGKSIADVLDMSVEQAIHFFEAYSSISHKLQLLADVGMGYLKVGQRTHTLSGGEAQRLLLIAELLKGRHGTSLYIFEIPSRGLFYTDVKRLNAIFNKLKAEGHAIVLVDQNPEMLRYCDHIYELTEDSDHQISLIGHGSPNQLSKQSQSVMGAYL